MTPPESVSVTYEGSGDFASIFVSDLEAEGLTVEWTPPTIQRSVILDASLGVSSILMAIYGPDVRNATIRVARRFRQQFPRSKINVDGDDLEDGDSV